MAPKFKSRGNGPQEHFTKMIRATMETPAWKALSPTAQALYPWLKLEWRGPDSNNNGKISLSVREAAERLGCNPKTAGKAMHDLQAKGFLVLVQYGRMGVEGKGAPPTYELTELGYPAHDSPSGRKLYKNWSPGHDFPVKEHTPSNPTGRNGKNAIPSQNSGRVVPIKGTKRP